MEDKLPAFTSLLSAVSESLKGKRRDKVREHARYRVRIAKSERT